MADAIIHTAMGDIAFDFFDHCPDAVGNFVDLAIDGLYDGTKFDELIRSFVIQGGNVGNEAPEDYLLDEYGPKDEEGNLLVAFDRPYLLGCVGRGDFSHPSMFFITLRPAEHLNWHHTIFGEVTDDASRALVKQINELPKGSTVTINNIEIVS